MKKKLTTFITIAVIVLFVSGAIFCGVVNTSAQSTDKGGSASYFESLNDFDWSRTCPAAGCRNEE